MGDFLKSVSDGIKNTSDSVAGSVRSTTGDYIADSVKSAGNLVSWTAWWCYGRIVRWLGSVDDHCLQTGNTITGAGEVVGLKPKVGADPCNLPGC